MTVMSRISRTSFSKYPKKSPIFHCKTLFKLKPVMLILRRNLWHFPISTYLALLSSEGSALGGSASVLGTVSVPSRPGFTMCKLLVGQGVTTQDDS